MENKDDNKLSSESDPMWIENFIQKKEEETKALKKLLKAIKKEQDKQTNNK